MKPSHEDELIEFLKFNGFRHNSMMDNNPSDREYVIVINIVQRFYFIADKFFIYPHITEREFYEKINYNPNEGTDYEELYDDEGILLYEGYVLNGYPCGLGRSYFDNGNIYQEGVFDLKGIKFGKEYYYSGNVKFEGSWTINKGYGPNAPKRGIVYNENGDIIFTGKFEVQSSGVGWPMIKHPAGYNNLEKNSPKIEYARGTAKSVKELPDIYTFTEEIQSYNLLELTALRDEFIERIKETESYENSESIKYHLYLSQVCKIIYEGEFENGYRE